MSVRSRLLTYFGLLAAAGACAFVVLWLYGFPALGIEGIQATEYRRSIATVEAYADKERDVFERWFTDRRRELTSMARDEYFSGAVADLRRAKGAAASAQRERIERELLQVREFNPGAYDYLYLLDPAGGRMLAASEASWRAPPAEHAPFLVEAAKPGLNEFVDILREGDRFNVVVTNQVTGMDANGSPTGEVPGILVAALGLNSLLVGDHSSVHQYLGGSGAVMLVDRDGKVLVIDSAVENETRKLVGASVVHGSEGVEVLRSATGRESLMAYRHLHLGASEGMSLVAIRDSDDALAAIRATFLRLSVLGAGMFFLVMALVVFAARRIAAAEAQIRALNAGLEIRVEQRTRELEEANAHLKDTLANLERTRDELVRSEKLAGLGAMVAGVAHELNTPIGNALLVATTLQSGAEQFSAKARAGLTRSALDQALGDVVKGSAMLVSNLDRAAELVKSFKQLATDQTSEMRRRFALAEICNEVALAMGPTLKRTKFALQIDVPADITMDTYPGPLSQVLVNFINNALVHGFEGRESGSMTLSARLLTPQTVEIDFADDGIGMTPEVQHRVFDPFFTTKLGKGGSGLGMHISYNIVTTLLGGYIDVVSAPGEGTRWQIILPLVAPQRAKAAGAEHLLH